MRRLGVGLQPRRGGAHYVETSTFSMQITFVNIVIYLRMIGAELIPKAKL